MDKIERVRREVEGLRKHYLDREEYDLGWNKALDKVLSILDTLEEEPVSEDLEEAIDIYLATYFGGEKEKQEWPFLKKMAIYFAQWHKQKDSIPVSEELEEVSKKYGTKKHPMTTTGANESACDFKEGAKWQQEQEYTCYEEAFEDGAKWKKEQMTAKAFDGEILEVEDNDCAICSHTHLELCIEPDTLEKNGFKDNDKVKVIVIKED